MGFNVSESESESSAAGLPNAAWPVAASPATVVSWVPIEGCDSPARCGHSSTERIGVRRGPRHHRRRPGRDHAAVGAAPGAGAVAAQISATHTVSAAAGRRAAPGENGCIRAPPLPRRSCATSGRTARRVVRRQHRPAGAAEVSNGRSGPHLWVYVRVVAAGSPYGMARGSAPPGIVDETGHGIGAGKRIDTHAGRRPARAVRRRSPVEQPTAPWAVIGWPRWAGVGCRRPGHPLGIRHVVGFGPAWPGSLGRVRRAPRAAPSTPSVRPNTGKTPRQKTKA